MTPLVVYTLWNFPSFLLRDSPVYSTPRIADSTVTNTLGSQDSLRSLSRLLILTPWLGDEYTGESAAHQGVVFETLQKR